MTLFVLLATALAQDCPDPVPLLGGAENDALNYYLAEAKSGLAEVIDAWGCGPAARPMDVGTYLRVRGLIAWLDGDEAMAIRAFAGAQVHGAPFANDYGPEARKLWDAAQLPEGQTTLIVKGRGADEWLIVDGDAERLELVGGLHLVQVGTGERARAARMVDARDPELLLALEPAPAAPVAPVPAPVEAPVEPEEPEEPEVSGTTEGNSSVVRGPFERTSGRQYVDASGTQRGWRDDLLPLAQQDSDGATAHRRYRSNPIAQGVALTLVPTAGYGAYLFGWDATVGHNLDSEASWGATVGLASVAVTAAVWETALLLRRPKRRAEVERAASRVSLEGVPD